MYNFADINLKILEDFPNWHIAVEFLRRSPLNYLLSGQVPPFGVNETLSRQIILQGVSPHTPYLTVPERVNLAQIATLCSALYHHQTGGALPNFGSIRGSNFIVFMHEFSKILQGKFEMNEVAQTITQKTCQLFDAEGASILLPNRDQSKFRFAYFETKSKEIRERLNQIEVPADRGVTGWVVEHRKPILVTDVQRESLFNPAIDQHTKFKTKDIMATDISIGGRLLAIIQVVNKRNGSFQRSDLPILELIAAIIGIFIEKAKLYEERLQFAKVEKELEIAHRLQTRMMPQLPARIGPFLLSGESRQVSKVGGDFWDVADLSEHEKLITIGDVSGHGLSAALVMSAVRTASRALLSQIASIREMVAPLNDLIYQEFGEKGHYATLLFFYLDTAKNHIHYFRAGHEHPILKSAGQYEKLQGSVGLPMGILPFRKKDRWDAFPIGPKDTLFLYTDGVIDGFEDENMDMHQFLSDHPHLEQCLDDQTFFSTLKKDYGWQSLDDATFLKLSLI